MDMFLPSSQNHFLLFWKNCSISCYIIISKFCLHCKSWNFSPVLLKKYTLNILSPKLWPVLVHVVYNEIMSEWMAAIGHPSIDAYNMDFSLRYHIRYLSIREKFILRTSLIDKKWTIHVREKSMLYSILYYISCQLVKATFDVA